jgi:hypothetical protein
MKAVRWSVEKVDGVATNVTGVKGAISASGL